MSYITQRRVEEKERRRTEILDAAESLYAKEGWDLVTVDRNLDQVDRNVAMVDRDLVTVDRNLARVDRNVAMVDRDRVNDTSAENPGKR